MNTTLTKKVKKNHFIEQLHKLGIFEIHGQPLDMHNIHELRRTLAIQRAINH